MTVSPDRLFYVSMIEGKRRYLIAGPYPTHDEARAAVRPAREKAIAADPFKHFALIGTCSEDGPAKKTVFGIVQPETWAARVARPAQGELAL